MTSVGIAIICKTPRPGQSKTRLSPPLSPEQCAAISACFIQDLAASLAALCAGGDFAGYALYTPLGSEAELRALLPPSFGLLVQGDGDLGARLLAGVESILALGHVGAIIVNADSPTLPTDLLIRAGEKLRETSCVVLGPALDGGYTFVGLSAPHGRLFEDIPWSTADVHRLTHARAAEIGLPVVDVAPWYDVDDAASLDMLRAELAGRAPFPGAAPRPVPAPATRAFMTTLAQG